MKKNSIIVGLLLAGATGRISAANEVSELAGRFRNHVEHLASDELEGRGVGTKGIEAAAEYIADQFKQAGLVPAGVDGTYFQPFPISLERKLTDGNKLKLSAIERDLIQGTDFTPLSFSSSGSFSGKLVFAGYGIVDPERNHDDFRNIDLQGKVALVSDGEPTGWADASGNPTRHSHRRNKVYNVKDRGATAILFFNPDPQEAATLTAFISEGADDYGLPAMQITRNLVEEIVNQKAGHGQFDLKKMIAEIGRIDTEGEVRFEKKTATTRNVLGALKGSGPKADEWVVVGGHYDHLGIRIPMSRTFKDGQLVAGSGVPEIHNGADDNASGIAGLIEIARGLAGGPALNRSVLFIAFSAEETGLQGSKYYAEKPAVPLDKTIAMLNMDMIGRLPENEKRVTVFGAKSADELMSILESAGEQAGLAIHPGVDAGGRSDHAVFARKQIPAMHFYSGNHPDYHKPSDDTALINAEGGARITVVVRETARALANQPGRPVYKEQVAVKPAASDPHAAIAGDPDKLPTFRVVMGLSPSYADDGKPGMGVDAVSPDGPADKAGMKAGDRILKINDKPIANIYDYMASTRNNKGGDTVEVVVQRDDKEVTLKVVLSGTR